MIVPEYWAESRRQHRQKGRQITVRRFGWSDTSLDQAQAHADSRADEALERLLAGEELLRREPKIPYNGAEGQPIREEIVERQGDTVITRNAYGARCLNTPGVFFADIDFAQNTPLKLTLFIIGLLLLGAAGIGWLLHAKLLGIFLGILALLSGAFLAAPIHRALKQFQGGPEQIARQRIAHFLARHPEWNLRLYRTPAGLRVMATHRTFDPNDPAVAECFTALGTDPLYALMCRNQRCFRARVSAKPWRIGISRHLRPGVWPVLPERLPARLSWIDRYEAVARAYAACKLLEVLGSGVTNPETLAVQEFHDRLCRATSGLPLA